MPAANDQQPPDPDGATGTPADHLSTLLNDLHLAGIFERITITENEITEGSEHHEALESSRIDHYEHDTRRALAVGERKLGRIECAGRHHGQRVNCSYATGTDIGVETVEVEVAL